MCTVSERGIYNQWSRDWTAHRRSSTSKRERERAGRLENLGVDVVKKLEKLEECGIGPETMSPMRTRDFY